MYGECVSKGVKAHECIWGKHVSLDMSMYAYWYECIVSKGGVFVSVGRVCGLYVGMCVSIGMSICVVYGMTVFMCLREEYMCL